MQKFTVFSIILSISVVLILGDIVFHDYLSAFNNANATDTTITVPADDINPTLDPGNEDSGLDTTEVNEDDGLDETAWVELTEDTNLAVLTPSITDQNFINAGFFDPVLKDTIFSGLIFQFIRFSDQSDAFVYQWNLFDNEEFIGSVYEIKYPSDVGSLQGYLTLRDRANAQTDMGTVNEVNNYRDASFYFNHATKTKTVHLVIRSGATIYAFEYAYTHHDKMKNLFAYEIR